MTDLVGFIQYVDGSGRALLLQQVNEPGTTFPLPDEAYDNGNPFPGVPYPEAGRKDRKVSAAWELSGLAVIKAIKASRALAASVASKADAASKAYRASAATYRMSDRTI